MADEISLKSYVLIKSQQRKLFCKINNGGGFIKTVSGEDCKLKKLVINGVGDEKNSKQLITLSFRIFSPV